MHSPQYKGVFFTIGRSVIQSEVSQKEKDKYPILMHIYRIKKGGTEEFISRAAVEKQT